MNRKISPNSSSNHTNNIYILSRFRNQKCTQLTINSIHYDDTTTHSPQTDFPTNTHTYKRTDSIIIWSTIFRVIYVPFDDIYLKVIK